MEAKWGGEWHPLAERFPMLTEDELRDMAASIEERGQYVPCRVTPDGLGLDGRNRVAACALAEVEPWWEVYDGDAIAFIVEVNSERRHFSTGQRAMATAIGLKEAGLRQNGRFKRGSVPDNAGARNSGWISAVRQAGVVLDHAPESVVDDVLSGELALETAYKEADKTRRREERIAALSDEPARLYKANVISLEEAELRQQETERLKEIDDDLAERVKAGTLDLDEAETLVAERRERTRLAKQQILEAFDVLRPMAGHPVPPRLNELLDESDRVALDAVLQALHEQETT